MKEVEKCEDLVEEDDVGVVVPVEDRLRVVDDQDALPEVVVMHLDGVKRKLTKFSTLISEGRSSPVLAITWSSKIDFEIFL